MTHRLFVLRNLAALCWLAALTVAAGAATSLEDLTPSDPRQGTINLERLPAEAPRERAPSGNPLWAIPLRAFPVTGQRPIFTPSRRPPAPPAVIAPPPVVQPRPVVARPVEPEHPNLALIGTVVGDTESIGVFLEQTNRSLVRLKIGEGYAGWILRSVKQQEATLEKDRQSETIRLPVADSNAKRGAPAGPGGDPQ